MHGLGLTVKRKEVKGYEGYTGQDSDFHFHILKVGANEVKPTEQA